MSDQQMLPGIEPPKQEKQETAPEALPEVLKGKSPEELYSMLTQEHNRLMAEAATLRSPPAPAAPAPAPTSQKTYVPPAATDSQDIFTNPEKFVGEQFEKRMEPIIRTFVQGQRELNRNNLIAQVGKEEYDRYSGEIETIVNGLTPELQSQPNSYLVAHRFVQASHLDDVVETRAAKRAEELVRQALARAGIEEQAAPPPSSAVRPGQSLFSQIPQTAAPRAFQPTTGGSKLSSAEKAMAKNMDLTEEEYMAYRGMNTDAISQMGKG